MTEESIIASRAARWRELDGLIQRAEGGLSRLSGEEIARFVRLYRHASADLAELRSSSSNREVVAYLNSLAARAYGQLYRRRPVPLSVALLNGLRFGADSVRRQRWSVALAASLLLLGAVSSFTLMALVPEVRTLFVTPEMQPLFDTWKTGAFDPRSGGESIAMTSFYATNNPRVGVIMNVLSLASCGTGTAYIVWQNGSIIGALAYEMSTVGKLGFLLASIAPHGVSEIGGFLVSGGGGFVLGRAVISPGRRTRSEAIRLAGQDAFAMLCVGLAMIVVAAPIEGFFSFNPAIPLWLKPVFALVSLVSYALYFGRYGLASAPMAEN